MGAKFVPSSPKGVLKHESAYQFQKVPGRGRAVYLFISCGRRRPGKPATDPLKSQDSLDHLLVEWACYSLWQSVGHPKVWAILTIKKTFIAGWNRLLGRVFSCLKHESNRFLPPRKLLLGGGRKCYSRYLLAAYTVLSTGGTGPHSLLLSWSLQSIWGFDNFRRKISDSVRQEHVEGMESLPGQHHGAELSCKQEPWG